MADFEKLISQLTQIKDKLSLNFAEAKAKYQVEFDKNAHFTKAIKEKWDEIEIKTK